MHKTCDVCYSDDCKYGREICPPAPSLLESYSKSAQKGQPSQSYAETTDCMRAKPMTLQMQAWSGHVGQKWQNLSWKRTLEIR
jgi:hypothetical protein